MDNNQINNIQKTFLVKDIENDTILIKNNMKDLLDNYLLDDIFNYLFSCEEVMKKLSVKSVLLIYEKIITSSYNKPANINLWSIELVLNIFKKSDIEIKILCIDILQKLKFNSTPQIEKLLILKKIYISEYLVPVYFTNEQINILKLDEEKKLYNQNETKSIEILDVYNNSQIYNDFFLSKNFLTNLSVDTLIYIIERIIKSEYNIGKYLFYWTLELFLEIYNSNKLTNKDKFKKLISQLNYNFSEEIIIIFIKNYFYLEKYFLHNKLWEKKFFVIVSNNFVINFTEKNINNFTDMIDFFLILLKNHNLSYNLLNIKKFHTLLKHFVKTDYSFLSEYYKSNALLTKLGFYFNLNAHNTCSKWARS